MRFWRAASSYLSYQAVHPLIIPALAIRLMARCAMVKVRVRVRAGAGARVRAGVRARGKGQG